LKPIQGPKLFPKTLIKIRTNFLKRKLLTRPGNLQFFGKLRKVMCKTKWCPLMSEPVSNLFGDKYPGN